MKIINKVVPLITFAAMAGCASTAQMTQEFNSNEVEWAQEEGDSSVTGQAFLRTVGGDVKTCAGSTVSLIPSSAYTDERIQYLYGSGVKGYYPHMTFVGKRLPKADPKLQNYVIESVCDASGRFEFSNVPAGNFYIVTAILWQVNGNSLGKEGGMLMQAVNVKPDSKRDYIITQ